MTAEWIEQVSLPIDARAMVVHPLGFLGPLLKVLLDSPRRHDDDSDGVCDADDDDDDVAAAFSMVPPAVMRRQTVHRRRYHFLLARFRSVA